MRRSFAEEDARQVDSQRAMLQVADMVDPVYTVVARFPKRHLSENRTP